MQLPDSIVDSFEKLVNEGKGRDPNKETFMYGTASVSGNDVTVQFDGADISTPVYSTVEVNANDRVLVMIKNHQATIISNITAPTAVVNGQTVTAIRAKYADLGGFISVADDANCWTKTSANGGHRYPTSMYKHTDDGTYEYEVGMKGDGSGNNPQLNLSFYLKRISLGDIWRGTSEEDMFYVRNDGRLYARDAVITGDIVARSFSGTYTAGTVTMEATLSGAGLQLDYVNTNPSSRGHVWLDPSNTIWAREAAASQITRNVSINRDGISLCNTGVGDALLSLTSSNGNLMSFGHLQTANSGNSAKTDIYSNCVEVWAEANGTTYEGDDRNGRFTASAAGNIGIYDITDSSNSNWIIYSDSETDVRVPHMFLALGRKSSDTTQRVPTFSSNVANQMVLWFGCTAASTLSIHGMWNSSSWSTKTVAVSSSDVRLKTDISDTKVSALDVINSIPVRAFTWKEDGVRQPIGVIADELEKLDPLLVVGGGEDENGEPIYKSINNLYLLGYVVKAIQELQKHDDGR